MKDIMRASVAVPAMRVADVDYNREKILAHVQGAAEDGATLVVLPELSLTGYTCADLFLSDLLLDRVTAALASLAVEIPDGILTVIGAPLMVGGQLYNCAVVLGEGRILGAVPKIFLQSTTGLSERRWFTSGADLVPTLTTVGCFTFPVSTDLLFRAADGTTVGIELCADLFAPLPPSTLLALAGAEVIVNPSATAAIVGARDRATAAVLSQSARAICAYLMVSAGSDESSSDGV